MASLTRQELRAFHNIDRKIFHKMVSTLLRDAGESLLVMALWIWLELNGYPRIFLKLVDSSDLIIFSAADEAVLCLNHLENNPSVPLPRDGGLLRVTSCLMDRPVTLKYFHENKFSAICGIRSLLANICVRIFNDILVQVLGNPIEVALNRPLLIPGFPHPVFGDIVIVPNPIDNDVPVHNMWDWDPLNDVDDCDKTVFLTFSRGFPVTKEEVTQLFSGLLGPECVKDVIMQGAPKSCNYQRLYAKLVLNSVVSVDKVLVGRRVAKFQIKGKHIWARKYERRN